MKNENWFEKLDWLRERLLVRVIGIFVKSRSLTIGISLYKSFFSFYSITFKKMNLRQRLDAVNTYNALDRKGLLMIKIFTQFG